MNRKFVLLIAAATFALAALSAFADTSAASPGQASSGAFVALGKTALGTVLVDARGRTLYLFDKDKRGKSACYGACAAYWPPLLSSAKPRQGKGVRASLLGLTTRTDGKRQVTYAGHPLYRFIGDKQAGQTTGEGLTDFGAAWDAIAASGRAVEPTTSDSTGASSGYGGGSGG
jgi:predicted lipoprotein with Yx(FWY)xxD motif